MGGCGGADRRAEMAVAKNVMQFAVGETEELLGLAVSIVLKPRCSQDRVLEGDRDRRVIATQERQY
ncbi:hypothetical protein D3C87_2075250 [compost metagenome]